MDAAVGTSPGAYALARRLARRLLRTQYRRVEVEGAERIPATGATILVANHGNGLVDSLALLLASPRPTSPLAKAPLWNNRLAARCLDAVGAIPVYREQDVEENAGRGVRANLATFEACRERLSAGQAIALFPEGVSQPQPRLLPLRTGVARIALDAGGPVTILPVGLVYEPPDRERGTILVLVGDPFEADGSVLRKPERRGAIAALTRRIEGALRSLLAEADSQSDLALLRTLRVAYEQEQGRSPAASLAEAHRRDQDFAHGLARLRASDPARVDLLRAQADAFARSLNGIGVPLRLLDARYGAGRVVRFLLLTLLPAALLAPLALLARLVAAPGRALGDLLLLRSSGASEDVRGFARVLGWHVGSALVGLLAAPLVGLLLGWRWAPAALLAPGVAHGIAVALRDPLARTRQRVRAFLLLAGRSEVRADLLAQRRALVEAVTEAAARGAAAGEALAGA